MTLNTSVPFPVSALTELKVLKVDTAITINIDKAKTVILLVVFCKLLQEYASDYLTVRVI
jgi:hypothetical protein